MSRLGDARIRVGACVGALLAIAAAGVLVAPPTGDAGATRGGTAKAGTVVVSRTALGCPALGAGDGTETVVDAVAPVLPEGSPAAPGRVAGLGLYKLGQDSGSLLRMIRSRGVLGSTPPSAKPRPVAVRVSGPLAAGAVATVTSTADEGVNRGMASIACAAPGAEFWFVGASSAAGRRDVLVLTNLDEANASVDVVVHGRTGVLNTATTKGVVVPGRGQAEVYLNTVAPNQHDLALRVVSTGGRVAAAVRANTSRDLEPAGVDWLPPAAPPARRVRVPAIAPGRGSRVLTVVNPGGIPASATITVHGASGRFKPARKESLQIPAGGVRAVRLDDALRGEAAAVSITAEEPLTAAVRMTDAQHSDVASTGAVAALGGPAYLCLPAHSEPLNLIVTAPEQTGTVGIELRDGRGEVTQRRELDVTEGATVAVPLAETSRPTYLAVIPKPGGDIVAGVTLTQAPDRSGDETGPGRMAAWPLTTSPVSRAQLGARPEVRAAFR